jgi:putative transposase
MVRPLRIEFSGALYHVTSRGDGRENIYLDDEDRQRFLSVLAHVCERFNWAVHAYCLMDNHYHLLIETADGNLSQGMRQLNGVYTQSFNRYYNRVGHVFQGRYRAVLVQKESYLLELSRYVVLNPVRAEMVRSAKDWPWSSYRDTAGLRGKPEWLCIDWLLSAFGRNKRQAMEAYRDFVRQGKGQLSPWQNIKNQIYLGTDAFVNEMQAKVSPEAAVDDTPAVQRRKLAKPLEQYEKQYGGKREMAVKAYASGGYSMKEIADYLGVHYSSVSRWVNAKRKT